MNMGLLSPPKASPCFKKVKFLIYGTILMKIETQHFHMFTIFGWSTVFLPVCFVMYIFLPTIWWSSSVFRKSTDEATSCATMMECRHYQLCSFIWTFRFFVQKKCNTFLFCLYFSSAMDFNRRGASSVDPQARLIAMSSVIYYLQKIVPTDQYDYYKLPIIGRHRS